MSLRCSLIAALAFSFCPIWAHAGAKLEPQLSDKDKARASDAIRKILQQRGFDEDAIAAIVDSGEGYEPTYGHNISSHMKSRWFGFDPETGAQYPSDVQGFATSLNKCYSRLSPNKYSRQYKIDLHKAQYPEGDGEGPEPSDETFGYCNYRFDPATGCKLSELEGFRCRYFFHNEGGLGTCDNWGAGPMLAFDPGNQGYAKLHLGSPDIKDVAKSQENKPRAKKKKEVKKVASCKFDINDDLLKKYLQLAKSQGYPN